MAGKKEQKRLVIVSGRSGSGKTVALRQLEDLAFYCVDNVPLRLIGALLEEIESSEPAGKLAVSLDTRNLGNEKADVSDLLRTWRARPGWKVDVLYLDADDDILLQRFKETRRRHPITDENTSLEEAIGREHELMGAIREQARLIDTGDETLHSLRKIISEFNIERAFGMSLQILSFGFKYGMPKTCDIVFDVRCLPNPHWDKKLAGFTGKDGPVREFLGAGEKTREMYSDVLAFLKKWLACFDEQERHYMTVAVGCTGGRHRSVYFCERLLEDLRRDYPQAYATHRELEKNR